MTAWASSRRCWRANAQLDAKVRRAAARTTALNEQFLRRVAADLHDGPAQDLGFALMRLESMATAATAGAGAGGEAAVHDGGPAVGAGGHRRRDGGPALDLDAGCSCRRSRR